MLIFAKIKIRKVKLYDAKKPIKIEMLMLIIISPNLV